MKKINIGKYPLAKKFLKKHNLTIKDIDKAIKLKLLELERGGVI